MSTTAVPETEYAAIEASVLGVLLSAESLRDGAMSLLQALGPVVDDMSVALAVRDRDGLTLHVLAESGPLFIVPERLEPQFALGGQPGVDPASNVYVAPLRASGRVIGAFLFADAPRAANLVRGPRWEAIAPAAAAVMHALINRTDAELARLARSQRSIDVIIEGVAHQMANPLTGASAIAQLLIDDLHDDGQRAAVAQIRNELTRAFAVLSDVLDFQRDTHARDGILDLNAIAERVIRFRGYAIREQGIGFDAQLFSAYLPVRADAAALEHALLIVLRHAELRSHGTLNRRISVQIVELPTSEVAIRVTDSGAGDLPELLPAWFDLPFRADARQALTERPDLGYVASILRGCGGRLDVHASKADGTTISLVLPRAYLTSTPSQRQIA